MELSLFRPDFTITSFYKVFGYDPTGFECLLIKKSVIRSLQKQSSHSSSAFSGVLTPSLVRDVYKMELEHGGSLVFDETKIFSVMKSPVVTDDESPEDSMWIDLGQSPIGSASSVMPLPPPFWFTRKNRNNNIKKVENFVVKPHSPEIQEEYEADSSFRVLGRRVIMGIRAKRHGNWTWKVSKRKLLKATYSIVAPHELSADTTFKTEDPINDLHEAFLKFITMYLNYTSSEMIDQLRVNEIMGYLNILESEYGLVFTVSRGSTFKLLAKSYPFNTNKSLLTMFDHESQLVNWMEALGPLDMDSLGLSLFRPDFTITSFYKVFGYDPTGFKCLLIKKSVIRSLQKQSSHSSSAFSGVLTPSLVRDVYKMELEHGGSPIFNETEIFSIMKSPVATDDESLEDSMLIDLGQSPIGSSSSVMPLPPPFWFTRKNRNNNIKKVENFVVKPHSPEIQEEYEAYSSFRVLGRRVSFGLEEKKNLLVMKTIMNQIERNQ
ncbi:hypothetical protein Tco_0775839, partial [Tanacetum coccineum]